MTFQFSPEEMTQIFELINLPPDEDGTRHSLYDTIFNAITDFELVQTEFGIQIYETPKEDVEKSVWLWVQGARDVNRGDGYFADFIREYTETQYFLRTGEQLSHSAIQQASNDIAVRFATDIVSNGGILPDIDRTGQSDAGSIAAEIFGNNYSPWAGTILFPYLGVDQFTKDWILNPDTNEQKLLEGTYDLVSVAATAHTITNFVETLINALGVSNTVNNNNIGLEATEAMLEDLRDAANTFFQQYYDLPDEGKYQIGDDLPLYTPTEIIDALDYYAHPNFVLGKITDDAGLQTSDDTLFGSGDDIVHAGLGNDVIIGSTGDDRIYGGLGQDTVDYSTDAAAGGMQRVRVNLDANGNGTATDGFGDTDTLFGIEYVTGTAFNDEFRMQGADDRRIAGGGGKEDTLIYSTAHTGHSSTGVQVILDAYGNGSVSDGRGGTDQFTAIEKITGTSLRDLCGVGLSARERNNPDGRAQRCRKPQGSHLIESDLNSFVRASERPHNYTYICIE